MEYISIMNAIENNGKKDTFEQLKSKLGITAKELKYKQVALEEATFEQLKTNLGHEIYDLGNEKKEIMAEMQSILDNAYCDVLLKDVKSFEEGMSKFFEDMFRPVVEVKVTYRKKDKTATAMVTFDGVTAKAAYPLLDMISVLGGKNFKNENLGNKVFSAMEAVYAWVIDSMYGESEAEKQAKKVTVNKWAETFGHADFATRKATGFMVRAMQDVVNELWGVDEQGMSKFKFIKPMVNRLLVFDHIGDRNKKTGAMEFHKASDFEAALQFIMWENFNGKVFDSEFKK